MTKVFTEKKCLVVKNDGMGDLILLSGLLTELSKCSGYKITLATRKENIPIAKLIVGIDRIIACGRDSIDDSEKRVLQDTRYDLAIVVRRFIRENTFNIMSLIRAEQKLSNWEIPTNISRQKAEIRSNGWNRFSTGPEVLSELLYHKAFLENIFQTNLDEKPSLKLESLKFEGTPLEKKNQSIGIFISGASSKWSYLHWINLCTQLSKSNFEIIVYGDKRDEEIGKKIHSKLPGSKNFTGKLSIQETISHFSQLCAVISNDTGLGHLSCLVSPSTFIIQGGGTFGRFFPWDNSPHKQFIIHYGLNCYDCCWSCAFDEKRCLDFIDPNLVFKFIVQGLTNKNAPRILNLNENNTEYAISWRHPYDQLNLHTEKKIVNPYQS